MADIISNIANMVNIDPSIVIKIVRVLIVLVILEILYKIITKNVKKVLLAKVKSKSQRSNVIVFFNILRYLFIIIIFLALIFTYTGSWTGIGISAGLLTAALGWALQRPITGIAAWIMVVTKKPFRIGDRIIIGKVRGDVADITLTHIYISEIGGIVAGEENSGRIVMVPNSVLFEKDIINYTHQDDYTLDQVAVTVTYESNLDKAIEIVLGSAKKLTNEFIKETNKTPYARTFFQPSGIDVRVRYFAPAQRLQEFSSSITKEIFEKIREAKDVEIAYPHIELVKK